MAKFIEHFFVGLMYLQGILISLTDKIRVGS